MPSKTLYKITAGQPHPLASVDLSGELEDAYDSGYADTLDEIRSMRGLDESPVAKVPTAAADYANERSGELITNIDDTTRETVADMVARAQEDGLSDTELAAQLADSSLFGESRAQLIARTESATAWNQGTIRALRDAGEDYVVVSDPCECGQDVCDVDGQIWTLDEAEAEPIGHPNCGRDFRPLTEDELAEVQAEEAAGEEGDVENALAASAQNVGTEVDGAVIMRQPFYSEDQARDDHGRWTAGGDSRQELVEDVRQRISDTMPPGSKLLLTAPQKDELYVDGIEVPKAQQGEGHGTRAMKEVLAFADAHNLKVSLTPEPGPGKKAALERFYRGLGFRPASASRGYDPTAHGTWVRPKLSDRGGKKYGVSRTDIERMPWVHVEQFYSPDQPRDERGRWEGGASGDAERKALEAHIVDLKADRALTGPDSKDITDLVKGTSRTSYLSVPGIDQMHDQMGLHPTLNTPPFEYQKARDALFEKLPLQPVAIKDLTFTQPRINVPRVNDLSHLPAQLGKPVQVVSIGGRNYLMNGHHRVAAAHVAGMGSINAHVLHLAHAKFYSEDQERDDHGRWTSGGSDWGTSSMTPAMGGRPAQVTWDYPDWAMKSDGEHVYRGVTSAEYESIVAKGEIQSTGAHSLTGEGTQFGPEAATALSYVSVGRDNPAVTGKPVYVVEVKRTPAMKDKPDGYVEAHGATSKDSITRVWRFNPDGSIHVRSSAQKFYSEDQARGDNGRWISEGDASSLGGTTKKAFYRDATTGERHLFKPDNEKKVLAAVAASQIAHIANPAAREAQVVTVGGHTGLMQQFIPGTPLDHTQLSPADIHQLQREHVIDWATSQHDSHPGQFIRDEKGSIVALDKSQAWKHLGSDRLSENYHPNAAYGERPPLYNTLFRPGSAALAHVDPEAIRGTLDALKGISHEQLKQILGPYARVSGRGDTFIKQAHERLQNASAHFSDHYTRLLGRQVKFYSEDQLRDERGRWTEGGGSSEHGRAWEGKQVTTATKLSKDATGKIGQQVILDYLHENGLIDARPMNDEHNNYAIDMVQDHGAIEVKAGQVSNGQSAQQWRATIGEPPPRVKEWLKTASGVQVKAFHAAEAQAILNRKEAARAKLEKELGRPVKAWTYCSIINPDKGTADIYKFEGYHLRIGWNSAMAKAGYVTTVKYGKH